MTTVSTIINDNLLKEFRNVIYTKYGLKKGDFKKALEEAMFDYIVKYAETPREEEPMQNVIGRARPR